MTMIDLKTTLYCPQCNEEVTAEQYDAYTEAQCLTREQRRHYKSIVAMWNRPGKKKDVYFCCPFCNKWSRITEIKTYRKDVTDTKVIENYNGDIGLNIDIEDSIE